MQLFSCNIASKYSTSISLLVGLAFLFGCNMAATEEGGNADSRIQIICGAMTEPMLDTTLGFLLPVPKYFEPLSNPPTELYGYNQQSGLNVTIKVGRTDSIEKEKWLLQTAEQTAAGSLEIRLRIHIEQNGKAIFQYAFLIGENALFVTSTKRVDLDSLLGCFVAK